MNSGIRLGFVAAVVGLAIIAPFSFAAKEAIEQVKAGAFENTIGPALPEAPSYSFADFEPLAPVETAAIAPALVPKLVEASLAPIATTPVIDPVTTASIPAPELTPALPQAAPAPLVKGSAEFAEALTAFDDGDAAQAWKLAQELDNPVERRTIEWAVLHYHSDVVDYASTKRFVDEAPEFATNNAFGTRLEQALARERPASEDVLQAFKRQTPSSVEGQILLAKALLAEGDKDGATTLARQIWTGNFLTLGQERRVLDTFGKLLDRDAHWDRAMHLMMHDRVKGAERLRSFLSEDQKVLVAARAAVSRNDADAKAKLDGVPASMQTNPVFIYSRVQRAMQFELWESAAEWLGKAPTEVPEAAEWWYERRTLIRKLLDLGNPKLAFEVADGYRNGPEARMVDAHFHAGWIAMAFLDDAEAASRHFSAMAQFTTLPDSISQANYWLGRALSEQGDKAGAQAAFEAAAKFGTVYYGQLARSELGQAGVDIRPLPDARESAALFEGSPVPQAVRLLAAHDEKGAAMTLLRQHSEGLQYGGEFVLAAQLAQQIGAPQLSVAIATIAERLGTPLDPISFPYDAVPENARLATDRAAVFAVVRQESMFQIDAESPVGARGLMQLMPGTAKEVANEVGVDYSADRLVRDASYNALLGSTYLAKQLDRYDGSLVLAAAAYNAGPGNANKWIKAHGDPRNGKVDPVVWVEQIPFQETRTYVKRVLGNYLVYRAQLGGEQMSLKQALRTIAE